MAEAIELGELNKGVDGVDEDEDGVTEETRLIGETNVDDNLLDTSIPVPAGFNPNIVGESSRPDTSSIPNPRQDAGVIKRSYTLDKKNFLDKKLGIKLNKGDGPNSTLVFDEMEITMDKNRKQINGVNYKGVKVIILKSGKMVYSESTTAKNASAINEFKELIKKAKIEHSKTVSAQVEEQLEKEGITDVPPRLVSLARERSLEKINDIVSEETGIISDDPPKPENIAREFGGSLHPKGPIEVQLKALDIQKEHWKELSETEKAKGNTVNAKLFRSISEVSELKADSLRIKQNQRPEGEQAQSILDEEIETSDLTRFERFKKWAKENLGVISAIAISVGGIITTIIVGAKSAIIKGARATSNFAKGLANLAKKLGPVLGALLNIVAQILTLGAKGIGFLSKTLWILAIALAYFLYDKFKNRKK